MGMGAAAGVGRAVQGMANSPRVQTSGQGKGAGAVQPTQPQVPAQGGKTAAPGTILNPNNPNNVPMPGGKAPGAVQPTQPQSPYTPIGAQGGKGPITLPRGVGDVFPTPQVQQPFNPRPYPGQGNDMPIAPDGYLNAGIVPAQGGKAPLTPEQIAAISANADPARGLGLNLGDMLYGGGGQQPQVLPQKPGTPAPGLNGVPGNQNPRYFGPGKPAPAPVMPRPMPQVMPRQPTPKPAPQGLAQIQQMLRGRR